MIDAQVSAAGRKAAYLGRALRMVWSGAPWLTGSWGAVLVASAILPVVSVYLTRILIDSFTTSVGAGVSWEAIRATVVIAGLLAAAVVLGQLLQVVLGWIRTAQAEQIQDHVRGLVHEASYRADVALYESPDYHDHLQRARNDASRRPLALLASTGSLLQSALTLAGMAALVAPYGWWVPVALVVSTLPALYVVVAFNRRFHRWWADSTADRRWVGYNDWMLAHDQFAAELRLFQLGPHFMEAYQQLRKRLRGERLRLLRSESLANLGVSVFALAVAAGVLAWMVRRAFLGAATLGDIVLFYQAFDRGQNMMRSLLGNVGQIYANSLFLENLFEFLDLSPVVTDPERPKAVPSPIKQGIVFTDVTFRYPGTDRFALRQFNLAVPAGQVTALVGPNGAGKSTVIKLACRFYDPEEGTIDIDDVCVRDVRLDDLRRAVSVLFQSPVPYHATLRENIAFGDLADAASVDRVERAARDAAVDGIAARLPTGYDTLLGKSFATGTQLSGGEWQRVALARAFFRRSPILALDEPTSHMDSWAESRWLERLRQLAGNRTTLIVTHRFTVAMQADIVHVMRDGVVVESGTPAALVAKGGEFAESWTAQMRAAESGTV